MHLALPTRKSSNPPPYANRSSFTSRLPTIRRSRAQAIVLWVAGFGAFLFILSLLFSGGDGIPSGTPPVVIVTALDPTVYGKEYLKNIVENREQYAKKHGYISFVPNISDYNLHGSPSSWVRVPALRHALTKFPHSTYFWYLDQTALIMNPELKVEEHVMNPKRLESLMLKDQPIVPPDSVIKTFPTLKGKQADFVITQDKDGLSCTSLVLKRGEWAKFFLDTWFDPLYRSYNFQKADTHALEHIVQWHPTILSKLILIPERIMNSHGKWQPGGDKGSYSEGDFVIRFSGCEQPERDCLKESTPFVKQSKTIFQTRR